MEELGRLIDDEERETGSVAVRYYLLYAQAAGILLFSLPLIFYTVRQAVRMAADFWLADWMQVEYTAWENENVTYNATSQPEVRDIYFGKKLSKKSFDGRCFQG